MLIAVDASRATIKQRTGTEGYSLHIIRGLLALGGEHCFHLYFRDEPAPDLFPQKENVKFEVIKRPRFWTHTGLGPAVQQAQPDVLFVPSHVIPWPGIGRVPSVITVHDLGYLHFPDKHPFFDRMYLNWSTRYSARTARRIIAVSNATAHDLDALYNIPHNKIEVVHSGVDKLLQPVTDQEKIEALRQKVGVQGRYILHVGSIQPRKNLTRLIEAFGLIKDTFSDVQLVLAGRETWGGQRIMDTIKSLGLTDRVLIPGYISDDDLAVLYSEATVYAFPSLYEGFGFPALEAMACHTPVVCANTSSLPELVGDAALIVAPTDVAGFAQALAQVISDEALQQDLKKRGDERSRQFTWEKSSQATMDVLLEVASIETKTI